MTPAVKPKQTGWPRPAPWASLAAWIGELPHTRASCLLGGAVLVVYMATASLFGPVNGDTYAAAVSSWRLATEGHLYIDGINLPFAVPFQVETTGGTVTDRQPGVIFVAVPAYWLAGLAGVGQFSLAPAALSSAVVTALSIMVLYNLFLRLVEPLQAFSGAAVAAFATASWSISADSLWPHGPDQLWLGAALLYSANSQYFRSGLGFAVAIITRPVTAVMPLTVGVYRSLTQRHWYPAVAMGAASSCGLVMLVLYNKSVFESYSVTGGYPSTFVNNIAAISGTEYGLNILGTLVSLPRGLLVGSPFLIMLLPGLRRAWRSSPHWVRSAALSGLVYSLLHLRMNRFSGGHAFYGYRYPLEPLMMAAPLLIISWTEWVRIRPNRQRVFGGLVAVSLFIQWLGAGSWANSSPETDFWRDCTACEAVALGGLPAIFVGLSLVCGYVLWLLHSPSGHAEELGLGLCTYESSSDPSTGAGGDSDAAKGTCTHVGLDG